jgi:flagellar basal-body rod protein FlgF
MTLSGSVSYYDDPMTISVRGMNQAIYTMGFYTENIAYADIPGYQRKVPVVTTFAEQLGFNGVDKMTDTSVGRIHSTLRPLDFALNTKGYFQKLKSDGQVQLTRDGRFKLDNTGTLLSDDNLPVLSRQGTPIKLPFIPDQLDRIKVNPKGWVMVQDPTSGETIKVAQMGIAASNGTMADDVDLRQGYVEESNVFLHEEFVGLVPSRRSFQANRALFLTQSQALTRLIQEMGRTQ